MFSPSLFDVVMRLKEGGMWDQKGVKRDVDEANVINRNV
jgi:hypothetical protein